MTNPSMIGFTSAPPGVWNEAAPDVLHDERFELLGSVLLPHHIPFHFHGEFIAGG
jgi:hypothetical protein